MPSIIPAADVDRLKATHAADTRALVREVADKLFLAGERPTRALVRDTIGRGSMTTIDAALREWWDLLRHRMDAKISVPDVPESVVPAFQQAVAGMWAAAAAEGRAAFDEDRAAAQAEVVAAQAAQADAEAARKQSQDEANEARSEATAQAALNASLAARVEAGERQIADLGASLKDEQLRVREIEEAARAERAKHEANLAAFAAEREREREALEGQLAFATRQIDDARGHAKALQSDIERARRDTALEHQRVVSLSEAVAASTRALAEMRATLDAKQATWDAERAKLIEDANATLARAVDSRRADMDAERARTAAAEKEAKSLAARLASQDMFTAAREARMEAEIAALKLAAGQDRQPPGAV